MGSTGSWVGREPIPCLVGPAQQTMDTLAPEEVKGYRRVQGAILQMLNVSLEAYRRHLWEVAFGPDCHPHLRRYGWLHWLCPAIQTTPQVAEAIRVEHYISILPFKSKNWLMRHQPSTMEEGVVLMEAYASVEASAHLIPKPWKGQAGKKSTGCADPSYHWGCEGQKERAETRRLW